MSNCFRTFFLCGCCKCKPKKKKENEDQPSPLIDSSAEIQALAKEESLITLTGTAHPAHPPTEGPAAINDLDNDDTITFTSDNKAEDFLGLSLQKYDETDAAVKAVRPHHDELSWVRQIPVPPQPSPYPYFVTSPVEELHRKLFYDLFQIFFQDGLFFSSKGGKQSSPFTFQSPTDLRKSMDFTLPQDPVPHDKLLEFIQNVINYQPHISHPFFMSQIMAGLEPISCTADLAVSCMNSNTSSYIVSTVATLIELEVIKQTCKLVGYHTQGDGDGVILPGSSLAIGYAMKMAYPSDNKQGLSNNLTAGQPYFFVNERTADAYQKSAIFQGFGLDSVIPVAALANGKMDLNDLQYKIDFCFSTGGSPCMVVGTIGTPIVRAIDDLNKIADICGPLKIWFHVDAMYGGALLCSETLKQKLKGVERSDSFAWSQNFLLGVPFNSTCFIVPSRHKTRLGLQYKGFGEGVGQAFRKTPLYDPQYDIRHKYLLQSKRPEVVKTWLMWKGKGTQGIGRHIDLIFENAQFCLEEMKKREGFLPLLDQFEGTNVCFWFVPSSYRSILQQSDEYREKVSRLTISIKKVLLERGICVVSYNELPHSTGPDLPTFLIIGLHNSALTKKDISYILDKIEAVAELISNPKNSKQSKYVSNPKVTETKSNVN